MFRHDSLRFSRLADISANLSPLSRTPYATISRGWAIEPFPDKMLPGPGPLDIEDLRSRTTTPRSSFQGCNNLKTTVFSCLSRFS